MTDKPNATAFIEDVLLPFIKQEQSLDDDFEARAMKAPFPVFRLGGASRSIERFIQSRRSEWEGK